MILQMINKTLGTGKGGQEVEICLDLPSYQKKTGGGEDPLNLLHM